MSFPSGVHTAIRASGTSAHTCAVQPFGTLSDRPVAAPASTPFAVVSFVETS
ncbi:hypothetical protein [uncultured Williamsia sp.]|uniref:hypothetical protein n=1 Tax=uncultured Williamsia sp. TaxID=259311 RepID=UPI00260A6113|nr:hypothetical protein [uncultured Williamsia sp.]